MTWSLITANISRQSNHTWFPALGMGNYLTLSHRDVGHNLYIWLSSTHFLSHIYLSYTCGLSWSLVIGTADPSLQDINSSDWLSAMKLIGKQKVLDMDHSLLLNRLLIVPTALSASPLLCG